MCLGGLGRFNWCWGVLEGGGGIFVVSGRFDVCFGRFRGCWGHSGVFWGCLDGGVERLGAFYLFIYLLHGLHIK